MFEQFTEQKFSIFKFFYSQLSDSTIRLKSTVPVEMLREILGAVCLALMYGNHLLSFYADYTHFRTGFCQGNECIKRYYYDESSVDQITAKDCVRCNDTLFDNMILPGNFRASRITMLKLCSLFFTVESVCYFAMAIAVHYRCVLVCQLCLAYLLVGLIAFFVVGIVSGNPLLVAHYRLFNFSNFYLLVRLCLVDGLLNLINESGWRCRAFNRLKTKITKLVRSSNRKVKS